jgi:hypothetical protein
MAIVCLVQNHGERYEILWNYQAIMTKLGHSGLLKLLKVDFFKKIVFLPTEMIQVIGVFILN